MRRMGGFDDEMFQAAQAEARQIHEDLLKLEAERDAASERDDDQEYGRIQEQIAEREDDFRRAQEHVDYVLSGADDDDDEDGDSGERLSVWDAADIWMSSGRDEDRMFGYTEEELRRAVEER